MLRPTLTKVGDCAAWLPVLHGEIEPPDLGHDDRALVREAAQIAAGLDWADEPWAKLTEAMKASTGRKGRALFMPLRLALTGRDSGPEMAGLLSGMGKERSVTRLEAAARR